MEVLQQKEFQKHHYRGTGIFNIQHTTLPAAGHTADHTTHIDHSRSGVQAKHNTVYLQRRPKYPVTEVLLPKETKPER